MLAAQATSRQTVSVSWTRSQEVWRLVLMAGNIRRFWRSSLGDSFFGNLRLVKDSETPRKWAEASQFAPETACRMAAWQPSLKPGPRFRVDRFYRSRQCPTRYFQTKPS